MNFNLVGSLLAVSSGARCICLEWGVGRVAGKAGEGGWCKCECELSDGWKWWK